MEPIARDAGSQGQRKCQIEEPQVRGAWVTPSHSHPHSLSIDLLLDLRLDKQRFVVSGDIALAPLRAAEPLVLIVDVAKPAIRYHVNVSSRSLRGEVLRILAASTVKSADSSPIRR